MSEPICLTPIGHVVSERVVVQDDGWDEVRCHVELDGAWFTEQALAGLGDFSHVEILFLMDQVAADRIESGARRPRNNPAWPVVGVFAQRGKNRPNRLGLTVCRVDRVEGLRLYVQGLDAVDGSPVLDIKPWMAEFGPRGTVRQPAWVAELMSRYWS